MSSSMASVITDDDVMSVAYLSDSWRKKVKIRGHDYTLLYISGVRPLESDSLYREYNSSRKLGDDNHTTVCIKSLYIPVTSSLPSYFGVRVTPEGLTEKSSFKWLHEIYDPSSKPLEQILLESKRLEEPLNESLSSIDYEKTRDILKRQSDAAPPSGGEDDDRNVHQTRFIDPSTLYLHGWDGECYATLFTPLEKFPFTPVMWVIAVPPEIASKFVHHTLCTTTRVGDDEWRGASVHDAFLEKMDCGGGVCVTRYVSDDWSDGGEGGSRSILYEYRAIVDEGCGIIVSP